MTLEQHPDVVWYREQHGPAPDSASDAPLAPTSASTSSRRLPLPRLRAAELRELCLSAGADDAGFVELGRAAIADQRDEVLSILPEAATVVSLVFRLNRFGLRSTLHSAVDAEFQQNSKHANRAVRTVAMRLGKLGVRAVHLPVGFPFETSRWPGKMWPIAEKPMAEAAGMGRMGWHRCVIHPEFGGAISLGTVLVAAELDAYGQPLEVGPCFECKQCVSVCPTGAIAADGHFDFVSCYTHNYRERLGGFQDWVDRLARSEGTADYRAQVSDAETVSMWQNLSVGPQTKCDKCMAVCPAGREVIGEYLADEKAFRAAVSERLRDKPETIYVVPGSDAEASVTKRFPAKKVRRVGNGLRPNSPRNFLGRAAADLPTRPVGGPRRNVPLRLHRRGTLRGHGGHQGQDHHRERRPGGHRRPARDGRRGGLDRLPGQGEGSGLDAGVAEAEAQGAGEAHVGVCEVLPVVGG